MANRQYIGARYVPKFYEGSNGNNWDSGRAYEPLTVVTYLQESYTSKIPVPNTVGNPASNPKYWAHTGAYNAQVEQYREEVLDLAEEVSELYNTENYAERVEVYVDAVNGSDNNDGSSSDEAFETLDAALDMFNKGVSSLYVYIVTPAIYTITKTEINGVVLHIYGVDGVVINWSSGLAGKVYNSHLNIQCTDNDGEVEIRSPYYLASTFASWYCENCAVTLIRVKLSTFFTLFGGSFTIEKCKMNACRFYWCNGTILDPTFINNSNQYPALDILNECNITIRGTAKHENSLSSNNTGGFISCTRSLVRFACAFEENNWNTLAHKYTNSLVGFNSYVEISRNNLETILPYYASNGNDYTNFTIFLFENIVVNDAISEASPWTVGRTLIPENSDLNTYLTVGKYHTLDESVSQTISHTPYTSSGFRLTVSYLSNVHHIRQTLEGINHHGFYIRDIVLDDNMEIDTISSWYDVVGVEVV